MVLVEKKWQSLFYSIPLNFKKGLQFPCLKSYWSLQQYGVLEKLLFLKPVHCVSNSFLIWESYEKVSDLGCNWCSPSPRPYFKSAQWVVKKVLNTQCYQSLSLTMWFHAKQLNKKTLKKTKSLLYKFYYINSAPDLRNDQKPPKNFSLNCDLLNFFIEMVYFGWYLVNPHVQVVQNMFDKGGYR